MASVLVGVVLFAVASFGDTASYSDLEKNEIRTDLDPELKRNVSKLAQAISDSNHMAFELRDATGNQDPINFDTIANPIDWEKFNTKSKH